MVKLLGIQKQMRRCEWWAFSIALRHTVTLLRFAGKLAKGGFQIAMQHQGGVLGLPQIVKHGGGFFKKQRQVILNTCAGQPRAHIFIDAAFGRVAF